MVSLLSLEARCQNKFLKTNKVNNVLTLGRYYNGELQCVGEIVFSGSLFAAIGFFDTLATICGAGLFNLLYPLSLEFDFNGLSFLVSASLALVGLYLTR